jgi:hypothetical protein
MKLKERKPYLIMEHMRDILLESDKDIGVLINPVDFFYRPLGNGKFTMQECQYTIRYLVQKGYMESNYSNPDDLSEIKLTAKGFEEWLFPDGHENPNKIFLSHATKDKRMAGLIKESLEPDFSVFLAHDDIEGTAKWRDRILSEMKTSGIFLALRTENYKNAQYTEQECGFALAMGKRMLCVCIGTKASEMGFCGEYQGFTCEDGSPEKIADYCRKQFL